MALGDIKITIMIAKPTPTYYTLGEQLGGGTYGQVYKATFVGDPLNPKGPYAIKVITGNREIAERSFKAEKQSLEKLKQLQHPNIVKLYDGFVQSGQFYLVMQLCEKNLRTYMNELRNKQKLNQAQAMNIIKQLVAGLQCLHQSQIIHRDLKPENILVKYDHQGRPVLKITDFGLSREASAKLFKSKVGTPLYMSPQILKEQSYTVKSDIWSAGIIFYELLVGKMPWQANTEFNLLKAFEANKTPPFPQGLSDYCKKLLTRMLKIKEGQRIELDSLCKLVKQYFSGSTNNTQSLRGKAQSQERPVSNKSLNKVYNYSPSKPIKPVNVYLKFQSSKLIQIFRLDLQQFFDSATAAHILNSCDKVEDQYKQKIKEVFSCYTIQLQIWLTESVRSLKGAGILVQHF